MVVAATGGGPGWGTSRPAALGWGRTHGPPRPTLRHQRVAEADARDTLATEGTIFRARVWQAGGPGKCLGDATEPQLGHGVAVRGPSQKMGGLLGACSWKERWSNSLYLHPLEKAYGRTFSSFFSPSGLERWGHGSDRGSEVGGSGKCEAWSSLWVERRRWERRSRTSLVCGARFLVRGGVA